MLKAIKSIVESVVITDIDDNIIFVNQSFLDTYGYAKDELIGQHINIVRAKNHHNSYPVILPSTLKEGGWQGELINKRKDGSEFPIYLSTSTIKDENNNVIAIIGVANDITSRKNYESDIIKSENNFKELFENLLEGITIVDINEKFLMVNPEGERIFGAKKNELIGKTIFDFLNPEQQQIIKNKTKLHVEGTRDSYTLEIKKIKWRNKNH